MCVCVCIHIIFTSYGYFTGRGSTKLLISLCQLSRSHLEILNKHIFEFVFLFDVPWVSGGYDNAWNLHSDCPTSCHLLASLGELEVHPWCSVPHMASPSSCPSRNHCCLPPCGAWTWPKAQRGLESGDCAHSILGQDGAMPQAISATANSESTWRGHPLQPPDSSKNWWCLVWRLKSL